MATIKATEIELSATQARIICEEFDYVGDWVPYDTAECRHLIDRGVKRLEEAYGAEHRIETR